MFGMGGTEILVILIVALLFLGPDKLPEAAKSISKGIRDIKKQSRVLQRTIEDDEHIGGAIRDLKSALRGEDEPIRPPKPRKQLVDPDEAPPVPEPGAPEHAAGSATVSVVAAGAEVSAEAARPELPAGDDGPKLTMSPVAGEPDDAAPGLTANQDAALAALVKPAPNTIAHSPRPLAAATPVTSPAASSAEPPAATPSETSSDASTRSEPKPG